MRAPGMGYMLHTVNPRLFPEQLIYIINHAEDRLLFIDRATLPLVEAIAPKLTTVEAYVFMSARDRMPDDEAAETGLLLRGPAGGGEAEGFRMADVRREVGLHHLLHIRHDRQSEGRRLFAPRRRAAGDDLLELRVSAGASGRRARSHVPMAAVSRQRLEHAVHGAFTGSKLVLPGRNYEPDKLYELIEGAKASRCRPACRASG